VKIVIPDDYQDMVHRLTAFSLVSHHDVARYREPARDLDQLVARLADADVVVAIRERVAFSRALLTRLPKLRLIALVGRTSHMLDLAAATLPGEFRRRQGPGQRRRAPLQTPLRRLPRDEGTEVQDPRRG